MKKNSFTLKLKTFIMFNKKEDIDFILAVAMQGKPIEPIQIKFILEDFPEGRKIIIDEEHLFEILKVENGTVLMRPIGTSLLGKQNINFEEGTMTMRSIEDGEIVEKSM